MQILSILKAVLCWFVAELVWHHGIFGEKCNSPAQILKYVFAQWFLVKCASSLRLQIDEITTFSGWQDFLLQLHCLGLGNLRAILEAFRLFRWGIFFPSFKWTSCFTSLSRRMLFWPSNFSFCPNNVAILQSQAGLHWYLLLISS